MYKTGINVYAVTRENNSKSQLRIFDTILCALTNSVESQTRRTAGDMEMTEYRQSSHASVTIYTGPTHTLLHAVPSK